MNRETLRVALGPAVATRPVMMMDASQPEVFGPYVVYDQLGEGGMATVHRAVLKGIEGFERTIALKRLRGTLAADEGFVRGFVREARLSAQLSHSNIAQIYDLGRVDHTYYIAMELVPGHDVLRVLRRMAGSVGPMPVPVALELLAQVCDALDYAHNVRDTTGRKIGLVHRDVSPANLIVGHDGVVRVIDFGIAKATCSTMHTQTGTLKGKFSYLPPEAISGQVDARADLFSLGVVAYELLTACPLFKGATDFETLEQIRYRNVPPPSSINSAVWPEVDDIVQRALAKDPAQRWQSAAAMRAAIDEVTAQRSARATRAELTGWIEWAMKQPDRMALLSLGISDRAGDSVVMEIEAGEPPDAIDPTEPIAPAIAEADLLARKMTLQGWANPPVSKRVNTPPLHAMQAPSPQPPAQPWAVPTMIIDLGSAGTVDDEATRAPAMPPPLPAPAPPEAIAVIAAPQAEVTRRRSRGGGSALWMLVVVLCAMSAIGAYGLAAWLA